MSLTVTLRVIELSKLEVLITVSHFLWILVECVGENVTPSQVELVAIFSIDMVGCGRHAPSIALRESIP